MTSGEHGANVTMIDCVNGAGNRILLMFIFSRVHFKLHTLNGASPGSLGGANQSGWSTEELFA